MIAGVIICVVTGFLAIYTSYVVGQVKLKYPQVLHYSDVGRLMGGRRTGKLLNHIITVMFVLQLVLLVSSHALTGAIAFGTITGWPVCSIVFAVVAAILLFIFAIPPSFSEMAILGYIDFVSIIAAILITLIATGINAYKQPGGVAASNWSAYPASDTTFADAMVACTNIVFAYSFASKFRARRRGRRSYLRLLLRLMQEPLVLSSLFFPMSVCQFSFMEEMHTPTDYVKSIWSLGLIEIFIYTCTGAIGYAFIGPDVGSPALLSAGPTVSKVAFGIALPVIFISGSINTVTVCRFMMDRAFKNSVVKYVNTVKGWSVWLGMVAVVTVIAWVIAEAIPFFSDLLGIMSSLFISGFTFYIPGAMWLVLIRQGGFFSSTKNTALTLLNIGCIVFGLVILVGGFYGSVVGIMDEYSTGKVGSPFTCAPFS